MGTPTTSAPPLAAATRTCGTRGGSCASSGMTWGSGERPWYAAGEAKPPAAPTLPGLDAPALEPSDIPDVEFVDEPPPERRPDAGQWYDDWDRGD